VRAVKPTPSQTAIIPTYFSHQPRTYLGEVRHTTVCVTVPKGCVAGVGLGELPGFCGNSLGGVS